MKDYSASPLASPSLRCRLSTVTPNPDPEDNVTETKFLTILDIATAKLGRPARTGADFAEAGFAIMGGCAGCEASIAAYNAYPSTSGYWRCADCIGDDGFRTLAGFDGWIAEEAARDAADRIPETMPRPCSYLLDDDWRDPCGRAASGVVFIGVSARDRCPTHHPHGAPYACALPDDIARVPARD